MSFYFIIYIYYGKADLLKNIYNVRYTTYILQVDLILYCKYYIII